MQCFGFNSYLNLHFQAALQCIYQGKVAAQLATCSCDSLE